MRPLEAAKPKAASRLPDKAKKVAKPPAEKEAPSIARYNPSGYYPAIPSNAGYS
jgi:hypothetical protein